MAYTMDLQQLLQAAVHRADLCAVDAHFSAIGISDLQGIINLKAAFVALANVTDFEPSIRSTYKVYSDPSALFKPIKRNLEFAKYVRNKFVGHVHPQLIEKAIEWRPTLRHLVPDLQDTKVVLIVNVWLLETAINTYVDEGGKHKIFGSDTDLVYPPDMARFLAFLSMTVGGAIKYLTVVMQYWAPRLAVSRGELVDLELAKKAGETEFKFLAQ